MTDRLNDSPGVVVEQVQADMTRGEAVRRARTEKEAYVVLLELVVDRMSSSNSDNPQLCLQYWVFSPTTGKIKTSGATYSHTTRSGGVILTRRMPDVLRDHNLQQASREAAERILAAFKLQPDGSRIPRSY
ncbi:MAG TPA: hypothetical protein VGW36_05750 [Pyrinomonadaceae bacterium]|nr:hypothetical protein [Pyrinomonadaceae bacterium]